MWKEVSTYIARKFDCASFYLIIIFYYININITIVIFYFIFRGKIKMGAVGRRKK